jgi:hypothetical protein
MAYVEGKDRRHQSDSAILDEETLDPNMHYRFIQERPTSISRAKLKGYRLVRPSETDVRTLYDQEDQPGEDIIKHGDRILMAIPKSKHHRNRRDISEMTLRRLQSNDQKVRELARQSKVEIHDREEDD